MKSCVLLALSTCLPLLALPTGASEIVVDSTYPGLFTPPSQITVVPATIPPGSILGVQLDGTASGNLGTRWTATANGGAVLGSNLLAELRVAETGAQVALTGSAMQFNLSNNPASILGALGAGLGLSMDWTATAKFNATGNVLTLKPNSVYLVTFDLDTGSGLLNSVAGISPTFTAELLDGSGAATGISGGGGTLLNLLGLPLAPVVGSPGTGRVTAEFHTGSTVAGGAASLRFKGSATLPITLGSIGTNFATVSNLSMTQVDPYTIWADNNGLESEADRALDADPDHDGRTNRREYALATDPSSGLHGDTYPAVGDPDGSGPETSVFVMTIAVRNGASFSSSGGDRVATLDGVTYRVEGSFDLATWTLAVSEVTPNTGFKQGLPTLPSGWEYRSFRVPGETKDTRRAFLRLVIE